VSSHNVQEAGMGQSASPNGLTHGMRLLTLGEGANTHPAALSTHKRHTEKRRRRQQEMKETISSTIITIPAAAVFVKQCAAPFYSYTRIGMASPQPSSCT
jgi:hypothetical protein